VIPITGTTPRPPGRSRSSGQPYVAAGAGPSVPRVTTSAFRTREPTTAPPAVTQRLDPTPDALRRALGAFASGVTVVTALDGEEPVGFTCQSFASLSLDPPLVLFCATRDGRAWQRIRRAGRFCVNVLADDQVDCCHRFGSRDGRRFDGLDWQRSEWVTPALPGTPLRVHCDLDAVHPGGDHEIAVGAVLGLELAHGTTPLLFHRGRLGLVEPLEHGGSRWDRGDRWG
jgi:3-hydroxy-9,10-secoandrosta-1,3,5(10)-triene-9,17-dione monooxygenase reductase component